MDEDGEFGEEGEEEIMSRDEEPFWVLVGAEWVGRHQPFLEGDLGRPKLLVLTHIGLVVRPPVLAHILVRLWEKTN